MTHWSLEVEDSVGLVTYAWQRDRLSLGVVAELADLLVSIEALRGEVTVVELRGGERGFVPDADRDELARVSAGEMIEGDAAAWERLVSTLARLPQVSVAAVSGRTVGGGCLLALACTLRVGSTELVFGPVDVELGVIGTNACPQLVRSVGPSVSTELLLTRRELDAESAARIGLLSAIFAHGTFETQAHDWCKRLTTVSPASVFDVKRAVEVETGLSYSQFLGTQPPNSIIPSLS